MIAALTDVNKSLIEEPFLSCVDIHRDHKLVEHGCQGIELNEEDALACKILKILGRPNCILGTSLVSHFAYYPQRQELEGNTKALARYGDLIGIAAADDETVAGR